MEPVQITFRGMPSSEAIAERIRLRGAELAELDEHVVACRVLVEAHHRRRKGNLFRVRVEVDIPGADVIVSRQAGAAHQHEDVYVAIRDAFDAAARRVVDRSHRRRHETKLHAVPPHGRVIRIFPREGYGFIATSDGPDVYFHRHAVVDGTFDDLGVGSEVRFVLREGESENAPQASTVRAVGKHHLADVEAVTT